MAEKIYRAEDLFSLDEVARRHLPGLKNGTRWLGDKIRSREIPAVKVGRAWFMADDHIEAMFERLSNQHGVTTKVEPQPAPQAVVEPDLAPPHLTLVDGLTDRAKRRLKRA